MGSFLSSQFAEVRDLSFENRHCQSISEPGLAEEIDYPLGGSTGGILYGSIPFFCGGVTSSDGTVDICFTAMSHRKVIVRMPEKITDAGSIVIGEGDSTLFVTGGATITLV